MNTAMVALVHSYSALNLYENCPKNYFHQRVERSVRDNGNTVTRHGERVHKALELRLAKNESLTEETKRYERVCAALESLAVGGEIIAEQELALNADLKPTGWWDDDVWIRSKIDVLILNGPNAYVIDWKTGKRRINFSQLELFAGQVFANYPDIQQVKVAFVWLKTAEWDSESFVRDQTLDIWGRVRRKVARIEASLEHDNWPAKPSGLCGWCPCKDFCEFAKV